MEDAGTSRSRCIRCILNCFSGGVETSSLSAGALSFIAMWPLYVREVGAREAPAQAESRDKKEILVETALKEITEQVMARRAQT